MVQWFFKRSGGLWEPYSIDDSDMIEDAALHDSDTVQLQVQYAIAL